jgi:hypothetical protein
MNIQQLNDRITALETETRDQLNARLADNEQSAKRIAEEIAAAPAPTTISNADFQRAVSFEVKNQLARMVPSSQAQQQTQSK